MKVSFWDSVDVSHHLVPTQGHRVQRVVRGVLVHLFRYSLGYCTQDNGVLCMFKLGGSHQMTTFILFQFFDSIMKSGRSTESEARELKIFFIKSFV